MMIFRTLGDFLEELMYSPNEMFVHFSNTRAAVYYPPTEEFLFLDGDFSGTEEECEAELQRHLVAMGYA